MNKRKTSIIKTFLGYLPPDMGGEVEYYYRRGLCFYFRKKDKSKSICIRVSKSLLNQTRKDLVRGQLYKTLEVGSSFPAA